jgi:hypothetical protein
MPKFLIERQYLVPMYQHIVVEAETLEEACKKGISDDIDWDTQEMDCDSARATTITEARIVPEGYEADQIHCLIKPAETRKASRWICSAAPRFSTKTKRRLALCSRSLRNLLKTNNPPRPLGSS